MESYINNQKGTISEKEVIALMTIILDAFSYAHSKGVIHRDIKPSNIIIDKDNNIKILDFGIAKILDSGFSDLHTKTGIKIGTLVYMSPEQVKGEEISYLTDIYSLGIVLFQLLTGRTPYDSIKESEYEIQKKIVINSLPKMKSIYPYVSDDMQLIVDKATSKNMYNRYASCNEFKNALNIENNTVILSSLPDKYPLIKTSHIFIIVGCILFLSITGYMIFRFRSKKQPYQ